MESKEAAQYYLAGVFDGEGTAYINTDKGSRLSICNTDQDILEACRASLEILGIEWKEYKSRQKAHYQELTMLTVQKQESIKKFYQQVPIRCNKKKVTLALICMTLEVKKRDRQDRLNAIISV